MGQEDDAYILGTETAELNRLGYQHQVWSGEARLGWKKAGFSYGDVILDLGSGPGFCSLELAYLVGESGKVVALDRSQNFISFLNQVSKFRGLDIKTICADFNDMAFQEEKFDGIYHRWSLAWMDGVEEILAKLIKSLKPGGKIVSHEYYDWSTLQFQPTTEALDSCIQSALSGWQEMEGDINIGGRLPGILSSIGMKIESTRIMTKLARPKDMVWHWPKTFFQIYLPKLVERSLLDEETRIQAMRDFDHLENSDRSTLLCPSLIEVIASRP